MRRLTESEKMKMLEALKREAIIIDLKAKDKKGVIEELAAPVARIAGVDPPRLVKALLERERLGSTGIGGGVGIPHGKMKQINGLTLGFGISRTGVDFEAMDNRPTYLFFLLVTPENTTGLHLQLLARISKSLKNESFKKQLLEVNSIDEVIECIRQADEAP